MVILKKLKAATLVETLVASVIIIIVFLIGSLTLNNVFATTVKSNDAPLQNRIKELTYSAYHEQLEMPFYEETSRWDITIENKDGGRVLTLIDKIANTEKQIVLNEKP